MHIAEGFLPAGHAAGWWLASAPFVAHGLYSIGRTLREKPETKLMLGASGGFAFVLSALKLPSAVGSCSHATGIGLGAILFRPSAMAVLGSIVLLFQAMLLAHGGWTTLGANVFSMAIVGSWVAYGLFHGGRIVGLPFAACVFLAAMGGDLATYCTTAIQVAWAHPDAVSGFLGAAAKFLGILAFTQIPLAISEGLLTVLAIDKLTAYDPSQLGGLADFPRRIARRHARLLTLGIVLLIGVPLVIGLVGGDETSFAGADGQVSEAIQEQGYQPWCSSLWSPPNAEIESLLFSLQAAIGAGLVFYCVGYHRGQHAKDPERPHDVSD